MRAIHASTSLLLLVSLGSLSQACSSTGNAGPSNTAGAAGAVGTAGASPATAGAAGAPGVGGASGAGTAGSTPTGDAGASVGGAPATGGAGGAAAGGGGAGGTTGGNPTGYKYSKKLTLDTTAAGANVTGDVPKYPVSILLNATNFDFTQAKPDGSDIRFTDATGAALPYAIESWDTTAKLAALWVKVDIKGNATQTVTLSWGNATATAAADSHTVFDTKDGFLGVWHLAEPGSATAGAYKDATATGADLTGLLVTADSTADGRIGKAVSLSHASKQWLRLDGTKNTTFDVFTHVTYSIWTYAKTYPVEYTTPFAKGDNSWRIHMYGSSDWSENMNKHVVEMCAETQGGEDECAINEPPSKGSDVAPLKWFHWVAVFNDPTLTLYLNGVKEVSATSGNWKSDATYPVGVGNNSQIPGRSWDGYLDEARVMNVSKDENWIKLEFESQREGQKFVSYGATQQ